MASRSRLASASPAPARPAPDPLGELIALDRHDGADLSDQELLTATVRAAAPQLIVNAADRKVVGAHILGHDAGEMAQLLGITLKAGCTKDDFDRTVAVHPTMAEELVTLRKPTRVV